MNGRAYPAISTAMGLLLVLAALGCGDDDEQSPEPSTDQDEQTSTMPPEPSPDAAGAEGTMTADELSHEGSLLVIDDDGFHPDTIVVTQESCDFGCSATFDAVNEGTTPHTFTIDDSHFPADWLDSYGSVDWELAPGETQGGIYVSYLPGSSDDLNPEVLEFYCRIHPDLRGQFVLGD